MSKGERSVSEDLGKGEREDLPGPSTKFSDLLKLPWVKSSLVLGAIAAVIGIITLFFLKSINIGGTWYVADAKAFVANYGLVGIFLITILAGTLIPVGSPALVVASALLGLPKIPLILASTSGFTIGMMTNYALAYYLGRPFVMKRISEGRFMEITRLWNRYGWILYTIFGLIPVLPVELLSLVCGTVRARFRTFLMLTFVSRLIVFTILAYFGELASFWLGTA